MFQSLQDFLWEIVEDFQYFYGLMTKGDPDAQPKARNAVSEEEIRAMLVEAKEDDAADPRDREV
ncbi:hypothetical protein [Marivita sp. XM-24bin2]|jgi:hypothetical protein|uniref:hypothetical protein n=1 Tax=unclassified Marivita TaxID=2632480 RepID=UPI000D7B135F|nr:hypothetical protein [Marivita sp. XM-24bin2]MCR9107292.1 hypothetical protein [Paracoccaceae bacterium]PWL36582.1 MAG: hypothetical protein DCO97_03650 [Marivita sp. XM-24bin2]